MSPELLQTCGFCKMKSPYTFPFTVGVWCCKCNLGKEVVARKAFNNELDEAHKLMSSHSPLQSTAIKMLEDLMMARFISQLG